MHILGIDVSKDKIDVALTQDNRHFVTETVTNEASGFKELADWLTEHKVEELHACLEATGRYGNAVAAFLYKRDHDVSVVNPSQIHAYGRSKLRRNKNDILDAKLIADFCYTQQPNLWIMSSELQRECQELSRHIDTLKQDRQRKRNQAQSGITSDRLRRSIDKTIRHFDEEIKHLEQELEELCRSDEQMAADLDLLLSIPAIGTITACHFLAEVDIKRFPQASQLAAYAGLVPTEHTSGSSIRKKSRLSKKGNRRLRTMFFMPALSAHRFNPLIANLRQRLTQRGKSKMTVVSATMRKLLHLAYGVLKTRKPFDPLHVQSIPVGG